jgi:predicted Rossmann fold flavoprotein
VMMRSAAMLCCAACTVRPSRLLMSEADGIFDVLVVGGGAAGMFASIAAARTGASVLVLEGGTRPLTKVRISGGGRCNVMHDQGTWDERGSRDLLMERYPRGSAELTGPLTRAFSPPETAAWFEREGVELKREADGRVFPVTDDSATIVDALLDAAQAANVELRLACKVTSVEHAPEGGESIYSAQAISRDADGPFDVQARALILATGSTSHGLAASLGHDIAPLLPSLFSFRLCMGCMLDASLAGVSMQDAQLTFLSPTQGRGGRGKRRKGGAITTRGPLLITHRGLSGPAALKLSAFAAVELSASSYKGTLELNLAPKLSRAEVASRLTEMRASQPLKAVANANPFQIPKRLWAAVVCGRPTSADGVPNSGEPLPPVAGAATTGNVDVLHPVNPATPWGQLSKQDMRALEERVWRAPLPFSGKDSNKDEFVTCGGVTWASVDTKRMESRLVPGLFFAGELLDVDGITGGHNFQSCWTTGYVAGHAAAEHARLHQGSSSGSSSGHHQGSSSGHSEGAERSSR